MDAEAVWTWVIFLFEILGVIGAFFVGKKYWWGWAIRSIYSIPWFIFSIIYEKPGFIAMSLMWWIMNCYFMIKWRKEYKSI